MQKSFSIAAGLCLLVLGFFSSCSKSSEVLQPADDTESIGKARDNPGQVNIFKGPEVQMGNGKARSWISINHTGLPLEIGVELTDAALYGLPGDPTNFQAATFLLPLHQKAKAATPFDHITINWNVHGHEPEQVFDIPHFDFHFYMITVQEQSAIPPYEVAPTGFDNLPPVSYWPDAYFPTPGGVPQMGRHWIDGFFQPPFSQTLIYGSYNGRFTFVEPMITLDYLVSGATFSESYRQPKVFAPSNKYYPQEYNIYKNSITGKHYITLGNFAWR